MTTDDWPPTTQVLLEPALFGLAAQLPFRGGATQAMMVGNASAGVVVVAVSVALRLAAGGYDPSPSQLRLSARLFFAALVVYAAACGALYAWLRSTAVLRLPPPPSTTAAHRPPPPSTTAPHAPPKPLAITAAFRVRWLGLCAAGRVAVLPAACQFLIFGVTLTAWPSIPGAACAEGSFRSMVMIAALQPPRCTTPHTARCTLSGSIGS